MRRIWVVAAAVALALAGRVAVIAAQEAAPPADADKGAAKPNEGLDVHGMVDVGYRFLDLSGSDPAYRQMFDLEQGGRLFGLEFNGNAKAPGEFADRFTLSASGLGGDPFPTVQITAKKARAYDLRINWRKSRFVDTAPLTPTSIGGLDTQSVTDTHSWTTVRQIANIALTVDATSRLHFMFNVDRVGREGTIGTTRSLDFLGSPATWGAFARANPYLVEGPEHENADRATGGFAYARNRWSVQYKVGYQTYDQSETLQPVASPEQSINLADPTTAGELLSTLGWSDGRHQTSPTSELSYTVRVSDRVEWRGEYLYSRYRGPFSLDAAFQGTARANTGGTLFSPYDVSVTARGESSEPTNTIEQGVTLRPFDRWAFDVDYRYSAFSTTATGQLGSLIALYTAAVANPTATGENDVISWRQRLHTVDATATFVPDRVWTLQTGVRLSQRDVRNVVDGTTDPSTSARDRSIWPEFSIAFRPPTLPVSARVNLQSSYSDASYTRMSPVQRTIARGIFSTGPFKGLTIDAAAGVVDAELYTTDFSSHTRTGSVQLSYSPGGPAARLTAFGGLDYQSFLGTGDVTFLRGTAPITDVPMLDREIDRIWQAGLTLKATSQLALTASANFDRTTGADTIAGEPPLYGPVSFPFGTARVSYAVPHAGTVIVEFQRAYMLQDILPLNNFRANLFTIRYAKDF